MVPLGLTFTELPNSFEKWLHHFTFPSKMYVCDIHSKIDKMKRQRAVYQMKEQDKTPENN